jgi:hypothetical protein
MASLEYPGWLRARRDWRELTRGSTLFTILSEKVQCHDIGDAQRLWEHWWPFVDSLEPSEAVVARRQWKIARSLIACAQIADLDPRHPSSSALLTELLAALPQAVEDKIASPRPDHGPSAVGIDIDRTGEVDRWDELVSARLRDFSWKPPLSAAWAWDAIGRFKSQPRRLVARETTKVLLVSSKKGFVADLTLEALDGVNHADFFSDPATMSLIQCNQAFWDGVDNAIGNVRDVRRLWPAENGQTDVRWRLARQDGEPLIWIEDSSASAAFALALAKLAAQVSSVSLPQSTTISLRSA